MRNFLKYASAGLGLTLIATASLLAIAAPGEVDVFSDVDVDLMKRALIQFVESESP